MSFIYLEAPFTSFRASDYSQIEPLFTLFRGSVFRSELYSFLFLYIKQLI